MMIKSQLMLIGELVFSLCNLIEYFAREKTDGLPVGVRLVELLRDG